MMTIHRMMLKTHLLLTTHVRSVHSILFRSSLQTTKRRDGCAQSVPKRSETCAWKRVASRSGAEVPARLPLHATRQLTPPSR